MSGNLNIKLLKLNVCLLGTYCGISMIEWLYKYYKKWSKRRISEVLFTSDVLCPVCIGKVNRDCDTLYCYSYTLKTMRSFLDGAQRSIYLCMNIFTNQDLGSTILAAHERGIKVKIIANETTAVATGSQLQRLHTNGIPIKFQRTSNYVHHKFCLLDSDPSVKKLNHTTPTARTIPNTGVIMTGSMNWTFQAMDLNWENTLITSDRFFVREFHDEFLRMWEHHNIVDFD